jgi:hypothetical protein
MIPAGLLSTDQLIVSVRSASSAHALDDYARGTYQALEKGHLREIEAVAILEAVEERRAAIRGQPRQASACSRPRMRCVRARQVSPDLVESLKRRRRMAHATRLPKALCEPFTQGEIAVLHVIGYEVQKRGRCTASVIELAARAGVGRTTAQKAVRTAATHGLLWKQERRRNAYRNDTNVLTILSPEWLSCLRLGRQGWVRKSEPQRNPELESNWRTGLVPAAELRPGEGRQRRPAPRPGTQTPSGGTADLVPTERPATAGNSQARQLPREACERRDPASCPPAGTDEVRQDRLSCSAQKASRAEGLPPRPSATRPGSGETSSPIRFSGIARPPAGRTHPPDLRSIAILPAARPPADKIHPPWVGNRPAALPGVPAEHLRARRRP